MQKKMFTHLEKLCREDYKYLHRSKRIMKGESSLILTYVVPETIKILNRLSAMHVCIYTVYKIILS